MIDYHYSESTGVLCEVCENDSYKREMFKIEGRDKQMHIFCKDCMQSQMSEVQHILKRGKDGQRNY